MIDKAICAINKFVVNFLATLTITVKTPFIDFFVRTFDDKTEKVLIHAPSVFNDRRHYLFSGKCIDRI